MVQRAAADMHYTKKFLPSLHGPWYSSREGIKEKI
jgi:hypothetical protein